MTATSHLARAATPGAQVISLAELHPPANPGPSVAARPALAGGHPLHQVKATLKVCVGEAVLTVGELLQARKDHVIRLESHTTDPVDLVIEGKVVARGQLVAVGEHFGVRITELPHALQV